MGALGEFTGIAVMGEMDEVVKEFLVESYENLDRLDRDLVALEKAPSEPGILSSIFRTIHTIKGTSGFFGFNKLESVAHAGENLLSRLRDGELLITPDMTSGLLALVDAVRQMLSCVEKQGNEGDGEYSDLVKRLAKLNAAPSIKGLGQLKLAPAPIIPEVSAAVVLIKPIEPIEEHHVSEVKPAKGTQVITANEPSGNADSAKSSSGVSDSSIRVDVGLLDKLMNLVGELVLARNQILQFSSTQEETSIIAASQRLNLVTTELQEGVMKTRMQPIGTIWSKFPRVVRDLATMCNKKVRIEMEGKETEIDRTIIEAIKDPLTHVVRNSVDHGIEAPEVRVARGKPAEGLLSLSAFHEGGQVIIEITDDGAGINTEKVKAKAIQRGIITAEVATRMSEREVLNLIFAPGFSTAEKVTNVSGRGVGMDVVKTNIEKIGGSVDIQNRAGQGMTLKIKIPLTLAIIPALIVTTGGDRYAIPQVSLLELVRLEGEQARKGIEMIQGAPVYRLRGNLLPLVYLNKELKVERPALVNGQRNDVDSEAINIVVLHADDRQFGLVVDAISDTEEIVVKPLGKQLKNITAFAGATIMGDGQVALILDVLGIAQRANVVGEVRERGMSTKSGTSTETSDNRQTLLLFSTGKYANMAIPLSEVARLEEFPSTRIERTGTQDVVQYRGQIMPLVDLSVALGDSESCTRNTETLQVVVYSSQGRCVGLVVKQILDIVDAEITVRRDIRREGTLGSVVVQDRVTELLDLEGVIRKADPSLAEPVKAA